MASHFLSRFAHNMPLLLNLRDGEHAHERGASFFSILVSVVFLVEGAGGIPDGQTFEHCTDRPKPFGVLCWGFATFILLGVSYMKAEV
jgi:hypothetical protein